MTTTTENPKTRRAVSVRDRENIGWFWKTYLREKVGWLFLVLVLVISQGFVYQQFLRLTEDGLRLIFERGEVRDLVIVCFTVFMVIGYRGAISFVTPRLTAWIASDAIMKLRGHLIDHLMKLDLAYFENTRPGENILRLTTQAEQLSSFLGQSLVRAVRDFFTIVILSIYLAWQQPILFGAAALTLPILILAMQIISRRIKAAQGQNQTALAQYTSGLEEILSAMRTVKIAGQEDMEGARLRETTEVLKRKSIEVQSINAMAMPFVDFAAAFVYALVIGGGGYMVLSPNFDVDGAAIIAFLIGLVIVFDPGRRLARFSVTLQANFVILDRVRNLFDTVSSIKDRSNARDTFDPVADIQFEDVSFSYDAEQPLFDGLNLTFAGGKTSAIVGPTGSGKTTILSLIARLYEPANGRVKVGDDDIRDIRIQSLRSAFSVVAQDIVIFDNSIWENIRYVRPDATDDEIWAAAEAAEIADLIRRRGSDPVGPKGAQLSGGQRQRIAIARAFLRNAPIVLLDEATSALDQATEERVKIALARLTKDRTTIVVAHRLSAVSDADCIFVMESGRLVEHGTHEALLAAKGLYAQLYSAQRAGYEDHTPKDG